MPELVVPPLERGRQRRSTKWQSHAPDVLPLHIAETDYSLAPVVLDALREAVESSDTGYSIAAPASGVSPGDSATSPEILDAAVTRMADALS